VHSEDEYNKAMEATNILFGKGTMADMEKLDENTFLAAMNGVPTVEISKDTFGSGITAIDLAVMHDKVPSKSEARKLIKSNGFSINKIKATVEKEVISDKYLINGKYLLLTKGKKDYTMICVK
jgi:tyrosyl-tRNA synthetase